MLTKYPIELEEVEGVSVEPTSQSSKDETTQKTTDTSALENLFKS